MGLKWENALSFPEPGRRVLVKYRRLSGLPSCAVGKFWDGRFRNFLREGNRHIDWKDIDVWLYESELLLLSDMKPVRMQTKKQEPRPAPDFIAIDPYGSAKPRFACYETSTASVYDTEKQDASDGSVSATCCGDAAWCDLSDGEWHHIVQDYCSPSKEACCSDAEACDKERKPASMRDTSDVLRKLCESLSKIAGTFGVNEGGQVCDDCETPGECEEFGCLASPLGDDESLLLDADDVPIFVSAIINAYTQGLVDASEDE